MKKIRDAVRYIDSCKPPVIRSGGVWYKGIRPVLKSRMDKVGKAELLRLMLRQWVFSPGTKRTRKKGISVPASCLNLLREYAIMNGNAGRMVISPGTGCMPVNRRIA